MALPPLDGRYAEDGVEHRYVSLEVDAGGARGPPHRARARRPASPKDAAGLRARGADLWALRAFRELDDVLLDLRFNRPEIGRGRAGDAGRRGRACSPPTRALRREPRATGS